ncbi:hypothetical protein Tco_0356690 [Tanacetum coccineum]
MKECKLSHIYLERKGQPIANNIEEEEEEASNTIKLEDLAKLVSNVQPSFKDLDSPEDDPVIVFDDSDKDKEDEVHTTTKDTSVPKSSSPSSLPTELKDLPSKFNELTKNLTSQVVELKTLQWELLAEFVSLPVQVVSVQAKLKTLDDLPSLLLNVIKALNKFAHVLDSASSKAGDQTKKNAEKENLNNQQPKPTTPSATTIIPPDAEEVSTESDSNDETTHVPGSMVGSSKKKDLKKFDFVTKDGEHVPLTKEQIMVNKYYNDNLQYDKYYDKMLNRRAKSRITNYDILTRKGPITLKVYREDDTREINPEFKASDLHLGEWREFVKACPNKKAELGIDLDRPLSEQDPLDRLNDLANKKRKHADDIHDFFRANKRLKSSVQYEDHPAGTVLNEPVLEIFLRLHQGLGLDDHARAFSSLLLAENDKRNLNPLKQMRVIEQLRQ